MFLKVSAKPLRLAHWTQVKNQCYRDLSLWKTLISVGVLILRPQSTDTGSKSVLTPTLSEAFTLLLWASSISLAAGWLKSHLYPVDLHILCLTVDPWQLSQAYKGSSSMLCPPTWLTHSITHLIPLLCLISCNSSLQKAWKIILSCNF